MNAVWDWLTSDEGARALAGLAGASVSAALDWTGVFPAARKIFIGFLSAYYLGEVVAPVFEWVLSGLKLNPGQSASGFLMGLVGMTVAEIIIKAFRLKWKELGDSQ